MTVRISVSLPDQLHDQLLRLASTSNVSEASTVRAVLSDVVPRMASVLDYLGTAPEVTASDVDEADAWLADLRRLYDRAPDTFREAIGQAPVPVDPRCASCGTKIAGPVSRDSLGRTVCADCGTEGRA